MLTIVNVVLSVWNTILRGLVLKIFWTWFIVNLFAGLAPISVLEAIGLSYFAALLMPFKGITEEDWDKHVARAEKKDNDIKKSLLGLLSGFSYSLSLAIFLGVGWMIHCFM